MWTAMPQCTTGRGLCWAVCVWVAHAQPWPFGNAVAVQHTSTRSSAFFHKLRGHATTIEYYIYAVRGASQNCLRANCGLTRVDIARLTNICILAAILMVCVLLLQA